MFTASFVPYTPGLTRETFLQALRHTPTATAATFFHSVILVFLSVHLLTGAFLCCNFLFLRNCHLHFIHARLLRVFK